MKKIIAVICTVVILFTSVAPISAYSGGPTFTDVPPDHWAYWYIEEMALLGIVNGKGGGIFDPEGQVTFKEFVTMMGRAFFADYIAADTTVYQNWWEASLKAVEHHGGVYYDDFIESSFINALTMEVTTEYALDVPVSRGGMASLLYEYLKSQLCIGDGELRAIETLPDYSEENNDYRIYGHAVEFMYSTGILAGVDALGTFDSRANMTRAQACKVLSEAIGKIKTAQREPTASDEYYTTVRLTNGRSATPANIKAAIYDIMHSNVLGPVWDTSNKYHKRVILAGVEQPLQGCGAFARTLQDMLFTEAYIDSQPMDGTYVDYDTKLLPGDQLLWWSCEEYPEGHTSIVIDVTDGNILLADGNHHVYGYNENSIGMVTWDRVVDMEHIIRNKGILIRAVTYPNLVP